MRALLTALIVLMMAAAAPAQTSSTSTIKPGTVLYRMDERAEYTCDHRGKLHSTNRTMATFVPDYVDESGTVRFSSFHFGKDIYCETAVIDDQGGIHLLGAYKCHNEADERRQMAKIQRAIVRLEFQLSPKVYRVTSARCERDPYNEDVYRMVPQWGFVAEQ